MSAVEALKAARSVGIRIGIDGNDLVLEATVPPPSGILETISLHKPAIIALLRSTSDGWSVEDWQAFFVERAAIFEFDGGLSRADADSSAYEWCTIEWLNRNPAPSPPGRCTWCGKSETQDAVVLPFGVQPGTHAWLHAECWSPWHAARRKKAMEALQVMGVALPVASQISFNEEPAGHRQWMESSGSEADCVQRAHHRCRSMTNFTRP
jgi:hypothetical protein